jgi:hypothetical protein
LQERAIECPVFMTREIHYGSEAGNEQPMRTDAANIPFDWAVDGADG